MNVTFTTEQRFIIDGVAKGNNAAVGARAGSGKTTLTVGIRLNTTGPMLVISYSKELSADTQRRFQNLPQAQPLTVTEVKTLHAFVQAKYGIRCGTDEGLQHVLQNDIKPTKTFKFEVIVLDEVQDFVSLFYQMCLKILRDNDVENPIIVVLGDRQQNIYHYKGSDARYLTEAPAIYSHCSTRPWIRAVLSETFRLNKQHVHFLNKVIFREELFRSNKDGPKPLVIKAPAYENLLPTLMANGISIGVGPSNNYRPGDVFVLSYSLGMADKDSPIKAFANRMSEKSIPIYFPKSGDFVNKNELTQKVIFSTIHGAKGRERKLVILFGADGSWFNTKAGREVDRNQCPTIWNVGFTRSSERLVLISDHDAPPLPYANWEKADDLYDVSVIEPKGVKKSTPRKITTLPTPNLSVLALLSHQPSHDMRAALQCLIKTDVKDVIEVTIPTTVKGVNGLEEEITDIIESGIALWAEYQLTGRVNSMKLVEKIKGVTMNFAGHVNTLIDQLNGTRKDLASVMQMATYKVCIADKLIHRVRQLPCGFKWMVPFGTELSAAASAMDGIRFGNSIRKEVGGTSLETTYDMTDSSGTPVVVKYRPTITDNDVILAGVISFFCEKPVNLFNFKTGQRHVISCKEGFASALNTLVQNKAGLGFSADPDAVFLDNCKKLAAAWRKPQRKIADYFTKATTRGC